MFFERPEAGSHVLLVHIDQPNSELATSSELHELAVSAGLTVVAAIESRRRFPHPGTYVGAGKLEEIQLLQEESCAQLVIFDADLSPTQERNVEARLGCRVLSRTGLILEIFAQRARTHEGKLQVELAQLQHAATRLVRGWTHLDRQRGGSGRGQGAAAGLGGAGETQLEADQRLLGNRIKQVNQRLAKVEKQRAQNRRSRARSEVPTVALAGYTNAGKSTLFNRMAGASVHAADQLFATLDPTLRRLELEVVGSVVLSDTVGFIRQLPHTLVEAFKATLEEVVESDLVLHVVDAAAGERDERMLEVNKVLEEIGASDVPQLLVLNKSDLVTGHYPKVERDDQGAARVVRVSALTGEGLAVLNDCIAERLARSVVETVVTLKPGDGKLRSRCFDLGQVTREEINEDGSIQLHLKIEQHQLDKLNPGHQTAAV